RSLSRSRAPSLRHLLYAPCPVARLEEAFHFNELPNGKLVLDMVDNTLTQMLLRLPQDFTCNRMLERLAFPVNGELIAGGRTRRLAPVEIDGLRLHLDDVAIRDRRSR